MLARNRLLLWMFVAILAGGIWWGQPATALAQSPTPFSPNSPSAVAIRDLMVLILWIAVGVFIVVEILLLGAVWRYRIRPGEEDDETLPRQVHGHTALEIGWTALPAVVLVVVFVLTLRTMNVVASAPPSDLYVKVIAHQWWWEFQYPDYGIVTAGDIHVPIGQPVVFEITSADVIHSFWVPELGGKTDAIPGRITNQWFTATSPGEFMGICAEFCGVQHAQMRFRVIAETPEEFEEWVARQQLPAREPESALAQRGREAFMTNACVGCHAIDGTAAQADVGPNLTHFGSREMIAAGALFNTPENLERWLRNPQAVKPGNLMPNLNLSEETIDYLVAYLESLE